jgi:hypothetical protein
MQRCNRNRDLWETNESYESVLDTVGTRHLLVKKPVDTLSTHNGGFGISSRRIRAVPTIPVISAHTATNLSCISGRKGLPKREGSRIGTAATPLIPR